MKTPRVGTVAYATEQGLGYLAKSFYDAGVIQEVLVQRHRAYPNHPEWYPTRADPERFLGSIDVLLCFETPFDWELLPRCKALGVKTVLVPMYEWSLVKPPYQFDRYICPSKLDQQYFPGSPYLPIPVQVPWRQRTMATKFVHNAGHIGHRGHKGTAELIEATRHIKSKAKVVIYSQVPWQGHIPLFVPMVDERLQFVVQNRPWEEVWRDGGEGDVYVAPEKFNGLSLPLQEARAAGMLVITTDRFPANDWLPREPLLPVREVRLARVGPQYNEFDECVVDPHDIAAKIDEWYGRELALYSNEGRCWAEKNSWAALKPLWLEELAK